MEDLTQIIEFSSFYEFACLLTLAAIGGVFATALRQPLIIAFILIGIFVGPSMLDLVHAHGEIVLLSKLGVAVLLFIVGLKLDVKLIRSLGTVSLIVGLCQVALTIGLGFLLSLVLGFSGKTSIFISVALAFSSTIIIVKVLSDKHEIDSLHGRIALGILIIQDLLVVLAMIVLTTFDVGNEQAGQDFFVSILNILLYMTILLTVVGIFMRYLAFRVASFVAKNTELMICFAVAWAVLLAAICDAVGLSKELGGLLAGVSLASTPYREAIVSRLSSLRDFLLLFFFVGLGTQIDLSYFVNMVWPALAFSFFVFIFKPVIIMFCTVFMGYHKRTGFLTGLSLAQISEFSLIFVSMAYGLEYISQDVLALVTLIALFTIISSTYLLTLSHQIYAFVEPLIGFIDTFQSKRARSDHVKVMRKKYDIVLFGLGRYGQAMAKGFMESGKKVLAVDFNPEQVKKWKSYGYDAIYGDASDPDFFHVIPLKNVNWVIAALPQHNIGVMYEDPRSVILQSLKDENYSGGVGIACHHQFHVEKFKKNGVDIIFLPHQDAADRAVNNVLRKEAEQ